MCLHVFKAKELLCFTKILDQEYFTYLHAMNKNQICN